MSKLGVMQPYFFPYAQQFRHINQCQKWIIFDIPKYTRKSWLSRNRIINKDKGWSHISVPILKNATLSPIYSAEIDDKNWKDKLLNSLKIYKNHSPHYIDTLDIVKECIDESSSKLVDLNLRALKIISNYLGIKTTIVKLSELNLNLPLNAEPGKWAYYICKEMNANIYSNAPGGKELFDQNFYQENNIKLEFYEPKNLEYKTPGFYFIKDLSIIDSLMWMGVNELKNWC